MKLIETGAQVDRMVRAQRRGLVKGVTLAWGDEHQDPSRHPFNNYSDEQNQSDRDVHERNEQGYPDWFYNQVMDKYGHVGERDDDKGKDR